MRLAFLALILLVVGCAAPATPPTSSPGTAVPGSTSSRPRVITAVGSEVDTLPTRIQVGGGTYGGDFNYLLNSPFTIQDPQGQVHPNLAAELPSQDNGTWAVNPDGTMETTWKIRPNALWHDGTPVTTADVQLAFRIYLDPGLQIGTRQPESFMDRIETVDDKTFTIHWKQLYPWANALNTGDLQPLPAHLVQSLYESLPSDQCAAHPFGAGTDSSGNGPFRLVEWDRGVQLVYRAFPDYFLGRPKLDEVIIRIASDPNTVVANLLAGTLDTTAGILLGQSGGVTLRNQWAQTGEGQLFTTPIRWRYVQIQLNPQRNQNPALLDVRVRRAVVHAIDRTALAEAVTQGTAPVSDMPILPADPLFARADAVIDKYPYDPARALALLSEAGWSRSGGGPLTNASGQPLKIDLWTTAAVDNEREIQILADDLNKLGMQTASLVIPQSRLGDAEYRISFPGLNFTAQSLDPKTIFGLRADQCPSPENRFAAGNNRGCYLNDEYVHQYQIATTALNAAEREQAIIEGMKIITRDVVYIPLSYNSENIPVRKGLVGPGPRWPGQTGNTWNAYQWYWE
jgi:peptide/nickel transport system substrate-binding protein